ncbi:MAG: lipoyl(octanoyl) transferase [Abditibacteriota bacterium]|nr:lipoyl(octanoyl) transferase [Abditibacteriota bacterium]
MNWRLMRDGAAAGAWNMAVDEALLLAQLDHSTLDVPHRELPWPVLRFYDWRPACLSLGRFQKVDAKYFEGDPAGIVRRPTGGRAVWHQHEITYCAVLRTELLPAGSTSVIGSYRWLSQALLCGLQTLGINARLFDGTHCHAQSAVGTVAARRGKSGNCFDSAAQCDTVVDNRKLIGAAQCRKSLDGCTAILQHGSLLLDTDEAAWQRAMQEIGAANEAEGDASMTNVVSLRALGIEAERDSVIEALCDGLARRRGASFTRTGLSAPEHEMAQRLYEQKYGSTAWNVNGREMAVAVSADIGAVCAP